MAEEGKKIDPRTRGYMQEGKAKGKFFLIVRFFAMFWERVISGITSHGTFGEPVSGMIP